MSAEMEENEYVIVENEDYGKKDVVSVPGSVISK